MSHISRPVVTSSEAPVGALGIIQVARHQAGRPGLAFHRDFAIVALVTIEVQQNDFVTGRGPSDGTRLHGLARKIPQQQNILRLTEPIANRDIPRSAHPLDDFWIKRLACACQLSKLHRE